MDMRHVVVMPHSLLGYSGDDVMRLKGELDVKSWLAVLRIPRALLTPIRPCQDCLRTRAP